jgi:hypothetical protein
MQKLYLYIYVSISFGVIFIQGCVSLPSDVIMPQWDTDLNVPITTKTYTLNDIIKSQNYISINSQDSTYMISSDSLSQKIAISQFLQVETGTLTPSIPVYANFTKQDAYVQFPDSAKLSQAVISGGNFIIVANNASPTDTVQLIINFPGITKGGKPFPVAVTVPPNTSGKSQIFDFINCSYAQPDSQISNDGQLWIQASAISSSTGHPSITFEASTSNFTFTSLTGYLPTKSLGTHSSSFSLNLGDASKYRDKVSLKTASLFLSGKYKSLALNPFAVQVKNLSLVGKRNGSSLTRTLTFTNTSENSFTFDASGNYSTVYNENNSNITSFITFLPDSIFVSAEYIMNPYDDLTYKTVRIDDSISFVTRFTSKSVLSIAQTTFSDTVDISIDHDKRDQILKGKGAQLSVNIQNAIPLDSWIKVTLTDQNFHPLLVNGTPFVITKNNGVDSVKINGALTDANGNFLNTSASNTTITLDSVQIRQFAQNAQHAIISVTVKTSGNNNVPVVVRAYDWIKLNVFGKVTYTVQKNN